MLEFRYLDPDDRSFDASLMGWLLSELPLARTLRFATGYFDGSVLDWLEAPLESLITRGGRVDALIGSNGGVTRRDDLDRLLHVLEPGAASNLWIMYAEGGVFHPKVFAVEGHAHVTALVGSANLTANGSIVNVEAGLVLRSDRAGPPAEAPLSEILESLAGMSAQDAFVVRNTADLDRLEELGIIGRDPPAQLPSTGKTRAARERARRLKAGVKTRQLVSGIPRRSRRLARSGVSRKGSSVAQSYQGRFYGLQFSTNDLKSVGTWEISVSSSIREWAQGVLGRSIVPREGKLFEVRIEARLAAAPGSISRTPKPERIWAAGRSGGTKPDVRLVLGSQLRRELNAEALTLIGAPIPSQAIGVFQLPSDPANEPVRLTVFLPADASFSSVRLRLGRTGRERKQHFAVDSLLEMPDWP